MLELIGEKVKIQTNQCCNILGRIALQDEVQFTVIGGKAQESGGQQKK